MSDVTRVLSALEQGDHQAAEQLLPLVYTELRRLASRQMAQEKPGQTLDATALVHEAYLRLVDRSQQQLFANRRHFFAAAAEAMRRILVEKARRKQRHKHGGGRRQVEWSEDLLPFESDETEILAVHEALDQFAQHDAETAELVKLHFFAGITIDDAAALLGMAPRSAYRNWAYARAWLFRHLEGGADTQSGSDPH
jgi:RNA polymerase sigma factor (TIGR02999 family)